MPFPISARGRGYRSAAPPVVTSYANPGGTGDRTATITVTTDLSIGGPTSAVVNGSASLPGTLFFNNQSVVGKYFKFDFGASYSPIINEAKFNEGPSAQNQGEWQWQGSANDSSWTNIGAPFFLGGTSMPQTLTELSANVVGYRYYRLLGVSAVTDDNPWILEMEFKLV